jgi:glycosyltransferase 2 family protein
MRPGFESPWGRHLVEHTQTCFHRSRYGAAVTRGQSVWVAAGLIVASCFLWLSLRSVDLQASLAQLKNARPTDVVMSLLLSFVFMHLKIERWALIIGGFARVPTRELYGPVYAGAAVNLVVAHVGEFVRAAEVKRRTGVAASILLASIGVERLLDFVAILILFGVLTENLQVLPPVLVAAADVVAVIVAVMVVAVLAILLYPSVCSRLADRFIAFLPAGRWRIAVQGWINTALGGVAALGSLRTIAFAVGLSLLQWSCIAIGIMLCIHSVGGHASAISALAVLILIVVGVTLPTAPAYLGTTQIGFTTGLALFHVGREQAFAASIVYTATLVMPMLAIGLICLYRQRRRSNK